MDKSPNHRRTLNQAREDLRPGDTVWIEVYYTTGGWSAAAHRLGQCWTRGHRSAYGAACQVAARVLYGNLGPRTPDLAATAAGALKSLGNYQFALDIPLTWRPPRATETRG